MKGDYLEGPLEAVEYEGKTWGVPWFTDAGMFYYRKDLLEESGFSEPPETWDEMKEMADKVSQDQSIRYGFVFQGAQDEGGVVDALEHVWNAGGDVLDGDEVIIDSPEAAEGLELRRSMITDGVAPQASGDYTTQESQAIFTNGDATFMRNWPFVYGLLSDPETSRSSPDRWTSGPDPGGRDRGTRASRGLGGWNFMVNAASEDQVDEIWTFIEFMSAPEQQKTFALESARLPTLASLYEDDEVLDKLPVAEARPRGAPERQAAAGLALLLGHVARDGRAVQRRPQGRRADRRGAGAAPGGASGHRGPGPIAGRDGPGEARAQILGPAFQFRKPMCYAASVAES